MTVSVTFGQNVGGDGSTYSDGIGIGGMAEGGHRLYFFPLLIQYLSVALFTVNQAALAANAASTAANAPGTSATTSTSITVGLGSKAITLNQSGKLFSLGQRVVVASAANPLNSVAGTITAFAGTAMTINVDATQGSGTYSDGVVSVSASAGVPATRTVSATGLATGGGALSANISINVAEASVAEIRAGTNTAKVVTPGDLVSSFTEVALQFGATITTSGDAVLDMSKFINARVTMGGNATLPNPFSALPGETGRIAFVQDATGGRLLSSWGSAFKCEGGKPVLSTTPGAIDYLYYDVITGAVGVGASEVVVSFVKAPSN